MPILVVAGSWTDFEDWTAELGIKPQRVRFVDCMEQVRENLPCFYTLGKGWAENSDAMHIITELRNLGCAEVIIKSVDPIKRDTIRLQTAQRVSEPPPCADRAQLAPGCSDARGPCPNGTDGCLWRNKWGPR